MTLYLSVDIVEARERQTDGRADVRKIRADYLPMNLQLNISYAKKKTIENIQS